MSLGNLQLDDDGIPSLPTGLFAPPLLYTELPDIGLLHDHLRKGRNSETVSTNDKCGFGMSHFENE